MKLGDYKGAAEDFKFFSKRKFASDDPNFRWRKEVFNKYGKALLKLEDYKEAVVAFNEAMNIEAEGGKAVGPDGLLHRGIALKKAGKKGFKSDWKKAAALGSKKAAELLSA